MNALVNALETDDQTENPAGGKRGRKRKTETDRRAVAVACRLTNEELAVCDARRGGMTRGAWLRVAALQNVPSIVPEVNREAWIDLARAAGNLNQIAKRLNASHPSGDGMVEEILRALNDFRNRLIGFE